ncbi:hypothetical protein Tco_0546925 [Tanacetum coccineum]
MSEAKNQEKKPCEVVSRRTSTKNPIRPILSSSCVTKPLLSLDILLPSIRFPYTVKIVATSRYVVPTSRVKVPAGRYVIPTGKDNVILSAGRSKVIPAGRTI